MAIDKNPRQFWLNVTDIEANVIADANKDFVTIEFAGNVTPSLRDRFKKALLKGEFELKIKSLV